MGKKSKKNAATYSRKEEQQAKKVIIALCIVGAVLALVMLIGYSYM